MRKILLALVLLLGIGFAGNYTACIDGWSQQENISIYINGSLSRTLSLNTTCDYGCDTDAGKCNEINTDFGLLVVMGMIFFTATMFWIANFMKPKTEEEFSLPSITLSMVFLVVGMFSLLGMLWYIGGLVSGFSDPFFEESSNWIMIFGDVWGWVVWIFLLITVIFYLVKLAMIYGKIGKQEGME